MQISTRDQRLVQLIARFKQASSKQIAEILFADTSRTMCDRALARLCEDRFLARIEKRAVGGARGGSGQYVYCLGRRGYYQYFDGSFAVPRAVNYHTLAITETYLQLVKGSRAGLFEIAALATEPDSWQTIAATELRPDMYIELVRASGRLRAWVEVDLGSEAQRQLRGKLGAYYRAYQEADGGVFPLTYWLVTDNERVKELRWLIGEMPEEAQALFRVGLIENVASLLAAV